MSLDSFVDNGPEGVSFEFEGKSYSITPAVAGGRVQRMARRKIAELARSDLQALLAAQPPLSSEQQKMAIESLKLYGNVRFADVARAHQIPEVLATVLQHSVAELGSYEEALDLVDRYPVYLELMGLTLQAMGLESLKNLPAPTTGQKDGEEPMIRPALKPDPAPPEMVPEPPPTPLRPPVPPRSSSSPPPKIDIDS